MSPGERERMDGQGGAGRRTAEIVVPEAQTPTGLNDEGGFFVTRVDALVDWARKNSLWPLPLGLSCCAIEFMATASSKFDMARFGAEVARFSPRQADVLVVAGTCTYKMAEASRRVYDQMAEPKWVICMGACASSGGMYRSYSVVQGIDTFLPVDFYISGCPPRPENVLNTLMKLQEKIARERPVSGGGGGSERPDPAVARPASLPPTVLHNAGVRDALARPEAARPVEPPQRP
jgi:NADH-quinone oxidoreductase subunit B